MAATSSRMLQLGTKAPSFSLINATGGVVSLSNFDEAKVLVVMFIWNHCPYVMHLNKALVEFANDFKAMGVECVAISSNDVEKYPQDGIEFMAQLAKEMCFPFPYLLDETQEIAKAYQAACTPDFYVFDSNKNLYYRGQFDNSRPGNDKLVTGSDLRGATQALLGGKSSYEPQIPSIGCNIKWKPGNEPEYFKVKK